MEVYPGQANVVPVTILNKSADGVTDAGGVTASLYLQARDGSNAGKWYRGSDQTWQVAESIASVLAHKGRGRWWASLPEAVWEAGAAYEAYGIPSSGTFILSPLPIVCSAVKPQTDLIEPPAGAHTVTVTVTDDSDPAVPVENVTVRYTSGLDSHTARTDAAGQCVLNVDDATWTVAATRAGYSYAGSTHAVAADSAKAIIMTTVAVPAPSDPDLVVCYGVTRTESGQREGEVELTIELLTPASPTGQYRRTPIEVTSDANGDWWQELGPGVYRYQRAGGANYPNGWKSVTVPAAAQHEFPSV